MKIVIFCLAVLTLLAVSLAGCTAVEYNEPCVCAAKEEATLSL